MRREPHKFQAILKDDTDPASACPPIPVPVPADLRTAIVAKTAGRKNLTRNLLNRSRSQDLGDVDGSRGSRAVEMNSTTNGDGSRKEGRKEGKSEEKEIERKREREKRMSENEKRKEASRRNSRNCSNNAK